jgi:hypothetical protein
VGVPLKTAIVSLIADEFARTLYAESSEGIKRYAARLGAVQDVFDPLPTENPTAAKFRIIRTALRENDRVIYLDPMVLVRFDCPNLFDVVPAGKLGVFDEAECNPTLRPFAKDFLPVQDEDLKHIFNLQVIIAERIHTELFAEPATPVSPKEEQVIFAQRVRERKVDWHSLPHRFNRVLRTLQLTGEQIEDSFIANFYDGFETQEGREHEPNRLAWINIADRFRTYHREGVVPIFRKRIFLETAGALGDVVATEPVIRYVRRVLEPDAEIVIKSEFVEVFDHLTGDPNTTILGPGETAPDKGHLRFYLFPEPPIANYNLMRPADYASLAVFRGMLPDDHRKIQLKSPGEVYANVSDHVLIHAGLSWESKTFPADWWNAVIQGIRSKGLKIALIGKTYQDNWRGTVDIDSTGCLDLRNKTTLRQLLGLIRLSPLLVSNDSSPVHISGAFENTTVMITSAKHPDYIWPFRDPSLNITLGRPIRGGAPAIGIVNSIMMDRCAPDDLLDVLPDPKEVVRTVLRAWKRRFPYGHPAANLSDYGDAPAGAECVFSEAAH